MNAWNRRRWISIGLLAVSVAGCGSMTSVTPDAAKKLAGTWQGTARSWRGSTPMTLLITDQGTFTSTVGSASMRGAVEVRDGRVVLVTPAGVAGPGYTATVIPAERGGKEVLNGAGTTEAGGFAFSLTRQP